MDERESVGHASALLKESTGVVITVYIPEGNARDLTEALDMCELTERLTQVYAVAQTLGGAHALPDDAVEAEAAMFRMRQQAAK